MIPRPLRQGRWPQRGPNMRSFRLAPKAQRSEPSPGMLVGPAWIVKSTDRSTHRTLVQAMDNRSFHAHFPNALRSPEREYRRQYLLGSFGSFQDRGERRIGGWPDIYEVGGFSRLRNRRSLPPAPALPRQPLWQGTAFEPHPAAHPPVRLAATNRPAAPLSGFRIRSRLRHPFRPRRARRLSHGVSSRKTAAERGVTARTMRNRRAARG